MFGLRPDRGDGGFETRNNTKKNISFGM